MDYNELVIRFGMTRTPNNEANSFITYLECKVLKSTLPIKAAMQYSDKLKIDKFLLNESIKKEKDKWRAERNIKVADKRIVIISNSREREYDGIVLNASDEDQFN